MNSKIKIDIIQGKTYPLTYHDDCLNICYVLSGTLQVKRNNHMSMKKEKDLFFINKNTTYCFTSEQQWVIEKVMVPLSLFSNQAKQLIVVEDLHGENEVQEIYSAYRDLVFIKDLVHAYVNHLENDATFIDKLTNTLLLEYNVLNYYHDIYTFISEDALNRFYEVSTYLFEHIEEKVNLEDIATLLHTSKSYFAQMWKQLTHMSYLDYVNLQRIYLAEGKLLLTNDSNQVISKQCGFSDVKYFYRTFSSIYKTTPTKWRELWQETKSSHYQVLTYTQSKELLDAILEESQYIKNDTHIYQQYIFLRKLKKNTNDFVIPIELYEERNYLVFNNQKILTWYGLSFLLRYIHTNKLKVHFIIDIQQVRQKEDFLELMELMSQYLRRYGVTIYKQITFVLKCSNATHVTLAQRYQTQFKKAFHDIDCCIELL